jgi:hypothetical protein
VVEGGRWSWKRQSDLFKDTPKEMGVWSVSPYRSSRTKAVTLEG